ncbi:hypothetical protein CONCODRAFT_4124 [Conidiobolus coronatus NRRL 28638]|uniref:C3H1-type domain-containing protein n=1 Tax=Conidiobolus coronatus (strain ATCC 28846 / CBS 209.66 / NRRL 28638) TaxID=796925 RepID=A0A137PD94_CONC2|nr:hypothetical protein CONCODRAFT_4124 [Conidiobolus coronatus NRRL 28638]|eukprot:KXN72978.1 hypothetical protein CONCODRAFT_4124 [Conidiobolus coronatus NRRL 28638]
MSSNNNNNDDPFAKLLNQHKEEQNKNQLEPNNNNNERQNNNNNRSRGGGRGRGRGRGGHFNRGGHHNNNRNHKRPREEDADEIRSKYLSRIKLDTPEDIAKWIADRKKNFPGKVNNEEDEKVKNPLGLIQDYGSSSEEEESDAEDDKPKQNAINSNISEKDASKITSTEKEKENIKDSDNQKTNIINDSTSNNEDVNNIENEVDKLDNNNNEDETEDIDEAPEFQTSQQTFQPSAPVVNNQQPNPSEVAETDSTPVCKFYSSGQRCFKGQRCPYLHIKSDKQNKPNKPNHKPMPSQYKRKDLINLKKKV